MSIDAPHLAAVMGVILEAPAAPGVVSERPFYDHAKAEMETVSKARGFPLPQDAALRRAGVDHFLLCGRVVRAA